MAIIETNWDVQKKDLRLFGAIGTVIFGLLAVGSLKDIGGLVKYGNNLLSWKLMAVLAVFSVIGSQLKSVPKEQKKYGVAGAVLLALLALAFYSGFVGPHRLVFPALAGIFLIGAVAIPDLLRPIYLTALVATFPIGLVVGPVIMGVIFFGIFTPVALIMKLIGRDTMTRQFDDAAPTYWVQRPATTDVKRYFRQF